MLFNAHFILQTCNMNYPEDLKAVHNTPAPKLMDPQFESLK